MSPKDPKLVPIMAVGTQPVRLEMAPQCTGKRWKRGEKITTPLQGCPNCFGVLYLVQSETRRGEEVCLDCHHRWQHSLGSYEFLGTTKEFNDVRVAAAFARRRHEITSPWRSEEEWRELLLKAASDFNELVGQARRDGMVLQFHWAPEDERFDVTTIAREEESDG